MRLIRGFFASSSRFGSSLLECAPHRSAAMRANCGVLDDAHDRAHAPAADAPDSAVTHQDRVPPAAVALGRGARGDRRPGLLRAVPAPGAVRRRARIGRIRRRRLLRGGRRARARQAAVPRLPPPPAAGDDPRADAVRLARLDDDRCVGRGRREARVHRDRRDQRGPRVDARAAVRAARRAAGRSGLRGVLPRRVRRAQHPARAARDLRDPRERAARPQGRTPPVARTPARRGGRRRRAGHADLVRRTGRADRPHLPARAAPLPVRRRGDGARDLPTVLRGRPDRHDPPGRARSARTSIRGLGQHGEAGGRPPRRAVAAPPPAVVGSAQPSQARAPARDRDRRARCRRMHRPWSPPVPRDRRGDDGRAPGQPILLPALRVAHRPVAGADRVDRRRAAPLPAAAKAAARGRRRAGPAGVRRREPARRGDGSAECRDPGGGSAPRGAPGARLRDVRRSADADRAGRALPRRAPRLLRPTRRHRVHLRPGLDGHGRPGRTQVAEPALAGRRRPTTSCPGTPSSCTVRRRCSARPPTDSSGQGRSSRSPATGPCTPSRTDASTRKTP